MEEWGDGLGPGILDFHKAFAAKRFGEGLSLWKHQRPIDPWNRTGIHAMLRQPMERSVQGAL